MKIPQMEVISTPSVNHQRSEVGKLLLYVRT